MRTLCLSVLSALLGSALAVAQHHPFLLPAVPAAPRPLLIEHISVIDVTNGNVLDDRDVSIARGRIISISKANGSAIPAGAQVLDARGKYLIPGLWDMHVHWYEKDYLPLFTANGVTGVRMMWGLPMHHEWRMQIAQGKLLGPRMDLASAIVDGPKPVWKTSTSVSTPAQARQVVDMAAQYGADFIKVYSVLPRPEYYAIAEEARRIGIPFAGHVTVAVSEEEASNAGQKSVEHLTGVLASTSTREGDLLQLQQAALAREIATGESSLIFVGPDAFAREQIELDTFSAAKARSLFALLKRNHTWQVPTLTVNRMMNLMPDSSLFTMSDPRMQYMPAGVRHNWNPASNLWTTDSTPATIALRKKVFQKELEIVGAMERAGVGILAGTDTLNPFCFPGFSLHDELGLLVQAGLTPLQALQTATLNPARYMGQEKNLGTVSVGKVADLVLLDQNPLADIANTKKINAVIYSGKLYNRAALDALLAHMRALAARQSIAPVLAKTIKEHDVAAAVRQYRALKVAQPLRYDCGEMQLESLAGTLLDAKHVNDAIRILQLNVEEFPSSSDAREALGEAYVAAGNHALAIANFRQALGLNALNIDAAKGLRQLDARSRGSRLLPRANAAERSEGKRARASLFAPVG